MRGLAIFLCASAALSADVRLPPYTREALPNGAVVYLMPRPGVPLVNFLVIVKGGMESEPADLAGIAKASAQLLRKGTVRRTADQFSNELDTLGGSFQIRDNEQAILVAGEFLKKDFGAGLDLMADAVCMPRSPKAR